MCACMCVFVFYIMYMCKHVCVCVWNTCVCLCDTCVCVYAWAVWVCAYLFWPSLVRHPHYLCGRVQVVECACYFKFACLFVQLHNLYLHVRMRMWGVRACAFICAWVKMLVVKKYQGDVLISSSFFCCIFFMLDFCSTLHARPSIIASTCLVKSICVLT